MLITETNTADILQYFKRGKVNLLMVAEKTQIDVEQFIKEADQAGYIIAGGIFPMIVHNMEYLPKGILLKEVSSQYEPLLFKDIGSGNLDFSLPDLESESQSCVVLLDGLMTNISRFLERIYEKYWNKLNYLGAGAGSLSLEQTPCIFTNEGLYQNAALLIMTKSEVQLGVNHGWHKISGPYVANKTDDNKIVELNWRPAFEVYKEVVEQWSGRALTEDNFFSVAQGFPFGIYRENEEDIVRDPVCVSADGSLTCLGRVSQNMSLNILAGYNEDLVNSAKQATNKATNEIMPSDIFVVDCISRVLYLQDDFKSELSAVKEVLDGREIDLAVEGVLSLGEISTGKGGLLEMYNKTIVVSAFY